MAGLLLRMHLFGYPAYISQIIFTEEKAPKAKGVVPLSSVKGQCAVVWQSGQWFIRDRHQPLQELDFNPIHRQACTWCHNIIYLATNHSLCVYTQMGYRILPYNTLKQADLKKNKCSLTDYKLGVKVNFGPYLFYIVRRWIYKRFRVLNCISKSSKEIILYTFLKRLEWTSTCRYVSNLHVNSALLKHIKNKSLELFWCELYQQSK